MLEAAAASLPSEIILVVVQSLNYVQPFVTPLSRSLLRFMSVESVMLSNHCILWCSLLLLPSIFPRIRVFSNESALCMRWPKYWSFSFSIILSKEIPGLISLQSKGLSRVFSNTTVQKHQFFSAQPSSQSNSHIYT